MNFIPECKDRAVLKCPLTARVHVVNYIIVFDRGWITGAQDRVELRLSLKRAMSRLNFHFVFTYALGPIFTLQAMIINFRIKLPPQLHTKIANRRFETG